MLQLVPIPELEQWPPITGGWIGSVLVLSEKWLHTSDNLEIILRACEMTKAKMYRSLLDYLFCELFIEFRENCQQFYCDQNQQLIYLTTPSKVRECDKTLEAALRLMSQHLIAGIKVNWHELRTTTKASALLLPPFSL